MRILFSIYIDEYLTGKCRFFSSKMINTNLDLNEIDEHLRFNDGFCYTFISGEHLSFMDFHCISINPEDVEKCILTIPNIDIDDAIDDKEWKKFIVHTNINDDHPAKKQKNCFLYEYCKVECGASGFNEIYIWATEHPFEMLFIGGAIWDITKLLWNKTIIKFFPYFKRNGGYCYTANFIVTLPIARFYKNLSKTLNISKNDIQIIKLSKPSNGGINVKVRTVTNEQYAVKSNRQGKIMSVNPIKSK